LTRRLQKLKAYLRLRLLDLKAVLSGQTELGIALKDEKHPDLAESLLMMDPLVFICRSDERIATFGFDYRNPC